MAAAVLTFTVTEPDGRVVPFSDLSDALAHRRAYGGKVGHSTVDAARGRLTRSFKAPTYRIRHV
jgi:hypothetical protein